MDFKILRFKLYEMKYPLKSTFIYIRMSIFTEHCNQQLKFNIQNTIHYKMSGPQLNLSYLPTLAQLILRNKLTGSQLINKLAL